MREGSAEWNQFQGRLRLAALRARYIRTGTLARRQVVDMTDEEIESVSASIRRVWPKWPPLPKVHVRALKSFRTMCGRFAKDVKVAKPREYGNCKRCYDSVIAGWGRVNIFQTTEEEFIAAGYTRRANLPR